MYLSAERLALANQAVQETFEQTSVAWQAIPHWETGDPAQTQVPNDNLTTPLFLDFETSYDEFDITVAEAVAPTPDGLLANVIAATTRLASKVDNAVIPALRPGAAVVNVPTGLPDVVLYGLIDARAAVEGKGYRAPSCLITDTLGIKVLNQLLPAGVSFLDSALGAATINALHRVDTLETPVVDARGYLLGRRQRISQGSAPDASAGEEPVDLAVAVAPCLEVVGNTPANTIRLRVRIRYATRVKDQGGLVVFTA